MIGLAKLSYLQDPMSDRNFFLSATLRYWKNQDLYFNNYKSDIQWDCHVTSECLEVERVVW